jgi:hypothetical protein
VRQNKETSHDGQDHMPSRHLAIGIIAFWVATTGWLFYRDLWPRFRPGGPPPFTIDLADEASDRSIRWTIYVDGQDRGSAQTRVEYDRADDTFKLSGAYRLWRGLRHSPTPDESIQSAYRVTRDGQLLTMHAKVEASILHFQGEASIEGHMDGNRLISKLQIIPHGWLADAFPPVERNLPPIDVPYRASVLNPQQPFNKIRGLSPGQRWRMPKFDPIQVISEQLMPSQSYSAYLDAEVLAVQPLPDLPLRMGPNMPAFLPGGDLCLPIEYQGENLLARTWVRESDSVVLRQEVTKDGQTTILHRDFSR